MSIYNSKYSRDLFTNPNTSFSKIIRFLPPKPKYILDVGCSSGFLGKYIKSIHSCHYTGVDFDKQDLALASKYLDHTLCLDLDSQPLSRSLFLHKFDVVILADILEHLRSPEKILKSLHSLVTPRSTIIISSPILSTNQ
jgi:2-polyprenyl-3-methyl-5-hydroxy-6-metoxy-1,4-benzoquinol methylase